CRDDLQPCTW
ncbi:hypothetical protein D043_3111B, partial [Vibrio parahaemolyticus EKP-021]